MSLPPNELPLEALTDRNVGIKLIGVGGGGSNAVDRLKMENLDRLQLAVINTDFKALSTSPVQDKILIGTTLTRGLSAGGDPELGRKAAEADADKIAEIVKGTDLIFLVAGLGGGREVEVKLPGFYNLDASLRGALKTAPGVAYLEDV